MSNGRRGHLVRELGGAVPLEEAPEPATDPPSLADAPDALGAALEQLAPEDRAAVELYVIEELPAQDIARILQLPNPKAVYNRVYRALAVLRGELERNGIERGGL